MSPDVGYAEVKGTKRGKLQDTRRRKFEEEKFSFISIFRRHAAHTNPSTSGRQEDRKKGRDGKRGREEIRVGRLYKRTPNGLA